MKLQYISNKVQKNNKNRFLYWIEYRDNSL